MHVIENWKALKSIGTNDGLSPKAPLEHNSQNINAAQLAKCLLRNNEPIFMIWLVRLPTKLNQNKILEKKQPQNKQKTLSNLHAEIGKLPQP